MIRKASPSDIDAVSLIYSSIHDEEEAGRLTIGWERGVYPVRKTAEDALRRGDLFVMEDSGSIIGAAIINHIQPEAYREGKWARDDSDCRILVLHTLVIAPGVSGRGYGTEFVRFYEAYALSLGCTALRMDTNARNMAARQMYKRLGYCEIGIVPTAFNGIAGVDLVLLEKVIA